MKRNLLAIFRRIVFQWRSTICYSTNCHWTNCHSSEELTFDELTFDELSFYELIFDELTLDELTLDELTFDELSLDELTFDMTNCRCDEFWKIVNRHIIQKMSLLMNGLFAFVPIGSEVQVMHGLFLGLLAVTHIMELSNETLMLSSLT